MNTSVQWRLMVFTIFNHFIDGFVNWSDYINCIQRLISLTGLFKVFHRLIKNKKLIGKLYLKQKSIIYLQVTFSSRISNILQADSIILSDASSTTTTFQPPGLTDFIASRMPNQNKLTV